MSSTGGIPIETRAQAPTGVQLVRLVMADGAQRAVKVTLSK